MDRNTIRSTACVQFTTTRTAAIDFTAVRFLTFTLREYDLRIAAFVTFVFTDTHRSIYEFSPKFRTPLVRFRAVELKIKWRDNSISKLTWLKYKIQLDAIYYFIMLVLGSTCFGHHYAHHQELTTIALVTT